MERAVALVCFVALLLGGACANAATSLKLVGAAPMNAKMASSVEKATLLAELRLNSLIAAAEGEMGTGRLDATSGKWLAEIRSIVELVGVEMPAPVIRKHWLLLEMPWRKGASTAKTEVPTTFAGRRFVVEVSDVEDDLARRLREKVLRFVEDYASQHGAKVLTWRQTLMKAETHQSGDSPRFSGKMEIVFKE